MDPSPDDLRLQPAAAWWAHEGWLSGRPWLSRGPQKTAWTRCWRHTFLSATGGEGCHSPSAQTLSDTARPGRDEGGCMSPKHFNFTLVKDLRGDAGIPSYLQQEALVLLHDAVPIQWGEDGVNDGLCVLLVQPLSCHQTGSHKPGVLSQPGQELPIDRLLKAQSLVPIDKLCVFQPFSMLATFSWRSLRTEKQSRLRTLRLNLFKLYFVNPSMITGCTQICTYMSQTRIDKALNDLLTTHFLLLFCFTSSC